MGVENPKRIARGPAGRAYAFVSASAFFKKSRTGAKGNDQAFRQKPRQPDPQFTPSKKR
jgi:hypothetical protein